MLSEFAKDGFFLFKNAVDVNVLNNLRSSIFDVFSLNGCEKRTDADLINFYKHQFSRFLGCANACQNLPSLHALGSSEVLIDLTKKCGIKFPNINTRPLIFFSCKNTAKSEKNWKLEAHQDWPSTIGSINGLTVWIPLQDTDRNLGCLEVIPQSHKLGYLSHNMDGIPVLENCVEKEFVPLEMELGDVLVFNWFCIHKSGINVYPDRIRYSVHFRYNDLAEESYIRREYFRNRVDQVVFDCNPFHPSIEEIEKFYGQ